MRCPAPHRRTARSFATALAALGVALAAPAFAQVGGSTSPIIGGHVATEGEQRATVALVDPAGAMFCTGTLVTPKVVVTAAHCFYDDSGDRIYAADVRVVVGVLDLTTPPPEAQRLSVAEVTVHPDYPYNPLGDEADNGLDPTEVDIAVVVLPGDLPGATTVPIASTAEADAALAEGARVELLGYGVSDLVSGDYGVLMAVPTSVLETTRNEFLGGFAVAGDGDACFGDSGGPAYAVVEGQEVLVGVTSRGRTDVTTDCGEGGIWTRADRFRRFVRSASGDPRVGPAGSSGGCAAAPSGRVDTLATVALALGWLAVRTLRRPRRSAGPRAS